MLGDTNRRNNFAIEKSLGKCPLSSKKGVSKLVVVYYLVCT